MKTHPGIGNVIAERELTFSTEQGEKLVWLRVGQPFQEEAAGEHPFWRCPLQFEGIGPVGKVYSIGGEDSLQALVEALNFARKELRHQAEKAGGTITAYGDLDVIDPSAKLLEFYGEAAGLALRAVRQAERQLRQTADPELRLLHAEMKGLVEKYGDR